MAIDIDQILGQRNSRRNKTAGFAGNRLFVEELEDKVGFRGSFGFFHDCRHERVDLFNELLHIQIFADDRDEKVLRYDWYPTHIKRLVKCHYVDYVERKSISRDDVAVSEVKLMNRGPNMETISPLINGSAEGRLDTWGQKIYYRRSISVNTSVRLHPGESCKIIFATAIGLSPGEAAERLKERMRSESMDEIIDEEKSFFRENVPEFHCDDELIEQIYYYRQYVLRHNLCRPDAGFLRHHVFFEGRTMGYGRLITASAALALDECRWWRNPEFGYGQISTLVENLPGHGIFRDIWINRVRELAWPGYEEWIPRAMADFLLVHPDEDMTDKVIEAGCRNIAGLLKHKDGNGNLLLNPGGHHMTQEHSPAFTHFHDYSDWYDYTDLERIEYQAFFYGSITGIAKLMEQTQDSRREKMLKLASDVREKTLKAMWHCNDKFFYAIRESDGAFARCKEGNGFLAFLFGLAPFEAPYTEIFRYLIDDKFFWNPFPIASCSKDIPSYSPHHRMWGNQKKMQGCTWSGPTWPYLDSLLVNVLSGLLRSGSRSAVSAAHLRSFFDLFTHGHLENGAPMIRENWDGIDGKQRGCPDYLHSTYIDLVVRTLMGFCPENESVNTSLSPLLGVNATLKGLPFAGKLWDLEVSADNKGFCVKKGES